MNAMGSNRSTQDWKRHLALGAVLLGAGVCLSAPAAWAANADRLTVTVEIKPGPEVDELLPSVSVSRTNLTSFVSARVKVANGSTNTVNAVTITATSSVQGGSGVAAYSSSVNIGAISPNCDSPSSPSDPTATCTIGQLKSLEGRDFLLIFQAPPAGSTITIHTHTHFSSGNSSNTPPADFDEDQDNLIKLITTEQSQINKKVKSVLPLVGGTIFTGDNATVSSLNPSSAKVVVPESKVATDNTIEQGLPTGSHPCFGTYVCFGLSSAIEINKAADGTKVYFDNPANAEPGAIVQIFLRQDASTLTAQKPIPKVGAVKIFYFRNLPGDTDSLGSEVLPCTAAGPSADTPCVKNRTDALKGSKGYYEYEIWAKDNGRFSW